MDKETYEKIHKARDKAILDSKPEPETKPKTKK